jgi:hypothetical protein
MTPRSDIDSLRQNAILASVAGFPFLLVFGFVWIAAGALSYGVPRNIAPWMYPGLGAVAAPIAMALERRLRYVPVANPDPLLPLALQLLFVQMLAFPAILLVWDATPDLTPVAFAAIVGAHFLPYQWLYQTRIYGVLAIIVAVGSYALAIAVGARALHLTGFFVGGTLLVGAFLVRSHAAATWKASGLALHRAEDDSGSGGRA